MPYYSRKSIEDFKSNLANGGVRPTMFEVQIVFPTILGVGTGQTQGAGNTASGDARDGIVNIAASEDQGGSSAGSPAELTQKSTFLVKASTLPGTNIGMIQVPFRGRRLKVSGDRTFNDWQTTIFNDNDYRLRDTIEKWAEMIQYHNFAIGHNQLSDGTTNTILGNQEQGYMGTGFVRQLDRQGRQLKIYKFAGIWPVTVDDIQLDFGVNDTIEEYGVTWAVQYWHAAGSESDNGPSGTRFQVPTNGDRRKVVS